MTLPAHLRSDIDLFSDSALLDPFPLYRQLRDIGPAAYLERYDLWFIGRYDQVRTALGDWQRFSSAQGIGLNPIINQAWADALISQDPPKHGELRKLFTDRLGPRHLKPIEDSIEQRANELADRLLAKGEFDAVVDMAQDLPVNIIMDLIGWPESRRDSLIELAEGSFNSCGPENDRMRGSLPKLEAVMNFVAEVYDAGSLTPGGFGFTIADAAKRGEISRDVAIGLLAGYVVAAFDTTINAIAAGVWLFAHNPQQWHLLGDNQALLNPAFQEVLRMETPIQMFSRTTRETVELGEGVVIPSGARVILSYGSANRDERHFNEPDRFNIARRPLDHLAFGFGNHSCAGQGLARLEGIAVFKALIGRVNGFELAGEPTRGLNNITRGFAHLPVRLT